MTDQPAAPARLRAAFVRRVHGTHGEVRVDALGGDAHRFSPGTQLIVDGDERTLTVRSSRDGGDGSVLLAFNEVEDAAMAEPLRGRYLEVDAASARTLPPDEWFTWQLRGLRVRSPSGEEIGIVEDVEEAVASDVLVVRSNGDVRRFPLVHAFVKGVDVGAGLITLEPQDEIQA